MVRGPFLLLLTALLISCSATPRRVDPFGAVPDDFSVDLTILSRPEGDRADRRSSRIVLEPDGSLRYQAKRGVGPNTLPPLVRRLDREQMARVWDSAARLGLTDPAEADIDADLRRVKPPSRRGCVWLLVLTGDGDRWNFTRSADGDEQPDAAIVAFGRELGALAWAPDRGTRVAEVEPVRWDYGPDPWAAYRGEMAAPVLVASAAPAPRAVEPPPPAPKPEPKVVQPPPPTPKLEPSVAPPPPPTPKPEPNVAPPPPPTPEPKVAQPPPPTPKPEQKVAPPPPPTPKPEPKVAQPPPPASKPEPNVAQPPPPAPRPEPKVAQPPPPTPKPEPNVAPPPPAPKLEPSVAPPPPPTPKPEQKVVQPPAPAPKPEPNVAQPPPPASKPEPKVVQPPAPAPKPEPNVAQPPPPAPKPKVVKPIPLRWPLDIRRIHIVWARTHQDLPSLGSCARAVLKFDQHGHRLSAPDREDGGRSLSIADINDRGGATLEDSAVRVIERSVQTCAEFSGLLGAKITSRLEPPTSPDGPFDLWVLVDVPLGGARAAADLPTNLIALPKRGGVSP